jgi:hypothetical protein
VAFISCGGQNTSICICRYRLHLIQRCHYIRLLILFTGLNTFYKTFIFFSPRPALFPIVLSCSLPCWPGWADHILRDPGVWHAVCSLHLSFDSFLSRYYGALVIVLTGRFHLLKIFLIHLAERLAARAVQRRSSGPVRAVSGRPHSSTDGEAELRI